MTDPMIEILTAMQASLDDVCLVNEHQLPNGIYEQTMAVLACPPSKKEGER
jgi:hypothetical protein